MHEIGIVEDLIKSIKQEINGKKEFKQIKKIYVQLGKSVNVSEESLRFWFENLSRGTELEGAALEFTSVNENKIVVESVEVE